MGTQERVSASKPLLAFACGGLAAPDGHLFRLQRATTQVACHNGIEHYMTSFIYQGDVANLSLLATSPLLPEYSVAVDLLNDPDKLMPQDTLEAHIAACNLQISIANSHLHNADQRLALATGVGCG